MSQISLNFCQSMRLSSIKPAFVENVVETILYAIVFHFFVNLKIFQVGLVFGHLVHLHLSCRCVCLIKPWLRSVFTWMIKSIFHKNFRYLFAMLVICFRISSLEWCLVNRKLLITFVDQKDENSDLLCTYHYLHGILANDFILVFNIWYTHWHALFLCSVQSSIFQSHSTQYWHVKVSTNLWIECFELNWMNHEIIQIIRCCR